MSLQHLYNTLVSKRELVKKDSRLIERQKNMFDQFKLVSMDDMRATLLLAGDNYSRLTNGLSKNHDDIIAKTMTRLVHGPVAIPAAAAQQRRRDFTVSLLGEYEKRIFETTPAEEMRDAIHMQANMVAAGRAMEEVMVGIMAGSQSPDAPVMVEYTVPDYKDGQLPYVQDRLQVLKGEKKGYVVLVPAGIFLDTAARIMRDNNDFGWTTMRDLWSGNGQSIVKFWERVNKMPDYSDMFSNYSPPRGPTQKQKKPALGWLGGITAPGNAMQPAQVPVPVRR